LSTTTLATGWHHFFQRQFPVTIGIEFLQRGGGIGDLGCRNFTITISIQGKNDRQPRHPLTALGSATLGSTTLGTTTLGATLSVTTLGSATLGATLSVTTLRVTALGTTTFTTFTTRCLASFRRALRTSRSRFIFSRWLIFSLREGSSDHHHGHHDSHRNNL
jgi:hypothetical protein